MQESRGKTGSLIWAKLQTKVDNINFSTSWWNIDILYSQASFKFGSTTSRLMFIQSSPIQFKNVKLDK